MIVFVALLGLLTGWLITRAAEVLPRFAVEKPSQTAPLAPYPAVWSLLPGRPRAADFALCLGVELSAGVYAAAVWARFGLTITMALLLAAGVFFLLVALIDWKYRLVLNVTVYPAVVVVLLIHLVSGANLVSVVLGGLLAFSIFFLTAWLKPGQLGDGDVKLALLLGLMFGFPGVLTALLIGGGVGAAVSLYLMVGRGQSRKMTIPYAPFLCLGAIIGLFMVL